MAKKLTLALSKGRVLGAELKLLEQVGIVPEEDVKASRKLIFATNRDDLQLMILRGSDTATYVEHGIADMGMTGRDVLLEFEQPDFYQPLDLKIGYCRLMVAGLKDEPPLPSRMKVATKFYNTTRRYYASQGVQVDIIKLYGAMELAPITGLAHRIVDIVDTGNTLKANGLVPMDLITDITTRLIVNKVSMKMNNARVQKIVDDLAAVVGDGGDHAQTA